MSTKVTPQRMHEFFIQAQSEMPEDARQMFPMPANWHDLSEQQRDIFASMARKANMIVSEFEVEPTIL